MLFRSNEAACTAFPYALLESDEAPTDDWLSLLAQLPAPVSAIYTSGGRSIHALIWVGAATKAEWQAKIDPLKGALKILGADLGALTGVRLSRLPCCWREEKGSVQRLLFLNPWCREWPDRSIAEMPIRESRTAALTRWRIVHPSLTRNPATASFQ